MYLNENLDFLLDNNTVINIDDKIEVVNIDFGDEDKTKIFCYLENDRSVSVLVLENIYDDIEVGEEVTNYARDNMIKDLLDGKIRPYIGFSFPKSEMGNKAITSLINNLVSVQKHLRKWN